MTTSVTGSKVTYKERIADIIHRYGEGDIVTKALRESMPSLSLAVARTIRRLRKCGLLIETS